MSDASVSNATGENSPIVFINIFTPRAGKFDEFVALQTDGLKQLAGTVPGSLGSQLHAAIDRSTVALVAHFESVAHHKAWTGSERFAERAKLIAPLVETAARGWYVTVHDTTRT